MNASGYSNYKVSNIETADQGKLILIVYDWAIRHCKKAQEADAKHPLERSQMLAKAQQAMNELVMGLNMEKGGEIAKNLSRLYDYMIRRLVEANIKKDNKPIAEVAGYLIDLRSAWVLAIEKERKNKYSAPSTGGLALVG